MRDAQTANSLGTILAKVFIGYGEVPVKRTKRAKAHDTDAFQLAEKAMKGRELTHGTKYVPTPVKGVAKMGAKSCRFSDGSMGPVPKVNDLTFQRVIGQFSFMYRSRSEFFIWKSSTAIALPTLLRRTPERDGPASIADPDRRR